MKNVLITTKHKGVFVGKIEETTDLSETSLYNIKDCKMVIRWRNGDGLLGVASYGPTSNCKISSSADVNVLHDVTAVFDVTDQAAAKIWADESE